MSNLKEKVDLEPVRDGDITPEHRAWMNAQVQSALDDKRSGKATYKTLVEVRLKFGF